MRNPSFALLLILTAATVSRAQSPLFLVDAPFDPPIDSSVYTVDPSSGAMTLRANLGPAYTPLYGLAAVDARTLYAAGSDNAGTVCSGGTEACLLLKIVLDPDSTVPAELSVVGPIHSVTGPVSGIVGMTFRSDGVLYVDSQDDGGLYTLDPATATATLIGVADIVLHGGDITFDVDDRLSVWSNGFGPSSGLYQMDPATAHATEVELDPGSACSGLAALGHGGVLYASGVFSNRLHVVDPVTGFTGESYRLTLDGAEFEHKRGDLDSPYCPTDAACDDANPCTTDRCTAGGCRHTLEDSTCDGIDDDCDGFFDEDGDRDGDLVPDCSDNCPAIANAGQLDTDADTLGDACDCAPGDPQNAPPPEVGSTLRLNASPEGTVLDWGSDAVPASFRVYRGSIAPGAGWSYDHACLGGEISGTSMTDDLIPTPGTLFYYAVARAGCSESVLARNSTGDPIPGGTCQ